jgi:cytochrome c
VITCLPVNTYVLFRNIDLTGIKNFKYRYAAEKSAGYVEVRIDSRAGPVISKAAFDNTGSWSNEKTLTGTLDNPVSGRHDVYFFVMKKEKPDDRGFVNLKQISFEQ